MFFNVCIPCENCVASKPLIFLEKWGFLQEKYIIRVSNTWVGTCSLHKLPAVLYYSRAQSSPFEMMNWWISICFLLTMCTLLYSIRLHVGRRTVTLNGVFIWKDLLPEEFIWNLSLHIQHVFVFITKKII